MNLMDLSKLESRLNTIDKRLDKIEKTLFKKSLLRVIIGMVIFLMISLMKH